VNHLWNTHLQFEAQLRKKASARSRQSSWLPTNQQCYGDDETTKLDAAGIQT
jgi:hypothetical protein